MMLLPRLHLIMAQALTPLFSQLQRLDDFSRFSLTRENFLLASFSRNFLRTVVVCSCVLTPLRQDLNAIVARLPYLLLDYLVSVPTLTRPSDGAGPTSRRYCAA